ncbi:MAG TPA: SAM-dependent methyltransferase [Steroidobacteraceae bacterium]|nr:SAM-dependent methyltransferase [Steroidobacteraceae bacterium]
MTVALELPPLTAEEHAHSERLITRICREIEAHQGWISFERYMEMALYEPGLGYYSAGSRKLGGAGDFVTAPEISPLFSRCVANQCAQVLTSLGGGEILEFGAGSGTMAVDVLLELERLQQLPTRYSILEVSADLRERQQTTVMERVPHLEERVHWLDALPATFEGVMLANEVLDAMPVERFRMRANDVNALGVTWQLGRLDWSEVRASKPLANAVRTVERELGFAFPDRYTSEINTRLPAWISSIATTLQRGVALLIDYGLPRRDYYRVDRNEGTLLCHFRHRFHDEPLINVGLQDIGAWVDFTAVADAAATAGLHVAGYCTQSHFLMGAGIERYLNVLASADLPARMQVARQAMVLTLPNEMGERFKVIGLSRGIDEPLIGFSVRDLSASL